jgi:hypothetical protein
MRLEERLERVLGRLWAFARALEEQAERLELMDLLVVEVPVLYAQRRVVCGLLVADCQLLP